MSSLSTLLAAARYLELQEQKQRQHRAALESALAAAAAASAARPSVAARPAPPSPPQQQHAAAPAPQQQQRVAVSSTTGGGVGAAAAAAAAGIGQQTVVVAAAGAPPQILQGPIPFSTPNNQQPVVKKMEQDGQISSTTMTQSQKHRILHNSFDIMNPLIIDETNMNDQKKIIQRTPMIFRAGTREVHNKLEKHRRAHLKECFDLLKKQLPSNSEEKKTSNLSILHSALRYIQTLKRKERELEHEMERLAREKISAQQKLAVLKKEISSHYDNVDFSKLLPEVVPTSAPQQHHQNNDGSINNSIEPKLENHLSTSPNINGNGMTNGEKVAIPVLSKTSLSLVNQAPVAGMKDVSQQPVQTTALSVVPVSYPVNQGLVLQKVAIVPNGLKELTPLMSTHFITTQQPLNGINGQLNGKVVPLAQYLVKPVVVVSTASPRPSS